MCSPQLTAKFPKRRRTLSLDHAQLLFWLQFVYFTGSIGGRLASAFDEHALLFPRGSWRRRHKFALLSAAQSALFAYGLAVAATRTALGPAIAGIDTLTFCLMLLFSFLHGYIVTTVFEHARREGKDEGLLSSTTGLFNQGGALCGSLLSFVIVATGLVKH